MREFELIEDKDDVIRCRMKFENGEYAIVCKRLATEVTYSHAQRRKLGEDWRTLNDQVWSSVIKQLIQMACAVVDLKLKGSPFDELAAAFAAQKPPKPF